MSSHDFPQRKSVLALLTVAGGLVAVMPWAASPAAAQSQKMVIIPCLTNPKTRNTSPPCIANPKNKNTVEPCVANPKNKNTITPCVTNPKSKGMTATSASTSQTPKNGNWDMNNLKQAPSDPSKVKTRY